MKTQLVFLFVLVTAILATVDVKKGVKVISKGHHYHGNRRNTFLQKERHGAELAVQDAKRAQEPYVQDAYVHLSKQLEQFAFQMPLDHELRAASERQQQHEMLERKLEQRLAGLRGDRRRTTRN